MEGVQPGDASGGRRQSLRPVGRPGRCGRRRADPPALLFVGRLIPEKGIFDLLEAMRILSRERACVLRVAGKGPCEAAIRQRVAALGLRDSVDFMGYVHGDALARLYSSSAALVLPTYFGEGFPTVITEAMSYGLPIVTTPVRGAADLLAEGENALFVPPHRPDELARALSRLLNDPGLAADMGQRNQSEGAGVRPGDGGAEVRGDHEESGGRRPGET